MVSDEVLRVCSANLEALASRVLMTTEKVSIVTLERLGTMLEGGMISKVAIPFK